MIWIDIKVYTFSRWVQKSLFIDILIRQILINLNQLRLKKIYIKYLKTNFNEFLFSNKEIRFSFLLSTQEYLFALDIRGLTLKFTNINGFD